MIAREIASLQHPIVKHLVKIRQNRDYRKESGSALITGKKMVEEISVHTPLKTLLIEKEMPLPPCSSRAQETFFVSSLILKKVTGLENPEPLAAEVAIPASHDLMGKKFLLAIDRVADPGNLGTLLRTALALGWEGAFLTPHTTDPFNEKALRAAKGATFRLPIRSGSWEELDHLIKVNRLQVFVADIEGEPLDKHREQAPLLLILSNEARGVSSYARERARPISIPMSGEMESLNVASAGAILMYLLKGKR